MHGARGSNKFWSHEYVMEPTLRTSWFLSAVCSWWVGIGMEKEDWSIDSRLGFSWATWEETERCKVIKVSRQKSSDNLSEGVGLSGKKKHCLLKKNGEARNWNILWGQKSSKMDGIRKCKNWKGRQIWPESRILEFKIIGWWQNRERCEDGLSKCRAVTE